MSPRLAATLAAMAVSLLVSPRTARAASEGPGPIELRPYPEARVLEPPSFDAKRDAWFTLARLASREDRESFHLEIPPPPPDTLEISWRMSRLELSVAADLGAPSCPITPRLDCTTRDAYFWLRASYDVSDGVRVFLESFQGAGAILGPPEGLPHWVWDGVQVEPGARVRLSERWTLESGPVLYAHSASHRASGCGTRIMFSCRF